MVYQRKLRMLLHKKQHHPGIANYLVMNFRAPYVRMAYTAALPCVSAGLYLRGEKDRQMEYLALEKINAMLILRICTFSPPEL